MNGYRFLIIENDMAPKKYYAVLKGRKTGIFTSWEECEKQVKGFRGALYKSFKTKGEAEAALGLEEPGCLFLLGQSKKREPSKEDTAPSSALIVDSICVDASCIGNPGAVEYRGVNTATREEIFHKQPMPKGTNNLGEFLAIVHGLAYLKNQRKDIPIYSDSQTAILWVKNKKIRTKLKRSKDNEEIFGLVDRALIWLENNEYSNPILKWNTVSWGEIPADFGRK
jgi:ribonuclease HI